MGTAILRSQDCLAANRFRHEISTLLPSITSRRNPSSPNTSPVSNASNSHSRRRKRSPVCNKVNPQEKERSRPEGCLKVAKVPTKNLVVGQVKILKRGEVFSSSPPEKDQLQIEVLSTSPPEKNQLQIVSVQNRKPRSKGVENLDLALGSTDRLGPEPDAVQKQIRVPDLKVADSLYAGSGTFYSSPPPSSLPLPAFLSKNDAATSDLIRMLRLDFA